MLRNTSLCFLQKQGRPARIEHPLRSALGERSGLILICGPAGSGKTTTAYAMLRHLVRSSGDAISLVTLEDPIEMALDGVAQSQVHPSAGFDFATGLRSLIRQDPEVVFVGEMLTLQPEPLGQAVLERQDSTRLEQRAIDAGMVTCRQRAIEVIQRGETSPAELHRVFGGIDNQHTEGQ